MRRTGFGRPSKTRINAAEDAHLGALVASAITIESEIH